MGSTTEEQFQLNLFISRVPNQISEEELTNLLVKEFGECEVKVGKVLEAETSTNRDVKKNKKSKSIPTTKGRKEKLHAGYAFAIFDASINKSGYHKAIEMKILKWSKSKDSKKTYRMYLLPKENDEHDETTSSSKVKNVCFLWSAGTCTHGDQCKFVHEGEGSFLEAKDNFLKKKKKCFQFKKKGQCKAGEFCPFSHEVTTLARDLSQEQGSNNSSLEPTAMPHSTVTSSNSKEAGKESAFEKDCINWKNKGRCNKKNCPYKHDPEMKNNKKRKMTGDDDNERTNIKQKKNSQPLSVRVFGLKYDSTKEDVQRFFNECGKIVEINFPVFEDSGRSKGFCGVLFSSPKAVEKAVELNGTELQGRWLSIQAGKMYLKQWEDQIAGYQKKKKY